MDEVKNAGGHAAPWNKGKLRPEAPTEAERDLGHSNSTAAGPSNPRTRTLQPRRRQQSARLRSSGLRVHDVVRGSQVARRAIVMQKKTRRPVQFELTEQTRDAVAAWIAAAHLNPDQYLFPSRMSESPHVSTRQYSRIVASWVGSIRLDPTPYGSHAGPRGP